MGWVSFVAHELITKSLKRHQCVFGRLNRLVRADWAPRIVETIVSMGANVPGAAPSGIGSRQARFGRMAKNAPLIRELLKIAAKNGIIGVAGSGAVLARLAVFAVGGARGRARSVTGRSSDAMWAGISFERGPGP
jgi:hypothetical protein